MGYLERLEKRIRNAGLRYSVWGESGRKAVDRISTELGLRIDGDLEHFILEVGNLRIDPLAMSVAGDQDGKVGAIPATKALRAESHALDASLVQVMDHAGEVYLTNTVTGIVFAYDALHIQQGQETMKWCSLDSFVDWMIKEAKAFQSGTNFSLEQ